MPGREALSKLFDRGINPHRIAELRARFMQLNTARLQRNRTALQEHQRLLFDLVPLLLHVNHPALPGYVSRHTPCGIDGYQPSEQLLGRARQSLSSGFSYRPHDGTTHIHSLFVMGSCGSIAQAEDSDLDIWLCHRSDLDHSALQQLQDKADALSAWAAGLGLDLHFFLMDSEQFRRGERERLSADGAGTSQHYLLLDEFYRSAILLAGRYPIWWLVPPDEEANYPEYTALLHVQNFVGPDESIDFGGVAAIPAGEFIGAGVWQLYKAIASPYKALLKLLLTEAYASDYPNVQAICLTMKARVHEGDTNLDELDPYIMVYRRLEQHLRQRGEKDRLELVRRAFYFKTGLHLSRPGLSKQADRRTRLEALVKEWQWPSETLLNLDTRHRWKLRRVRDEHRFLVAELTHSYRFLQDFAARSQQSALINSEEMTLLGRKLYAAFERKRNKIEWLNPGISPDLSEQQLYFYTIGFGDRRRWVVSSSPRNDFHSETTLKEDDQLCRLLCWCLCNGLVQENSRLRLGSHKLGVTESDLNRLACWLQKALPARLPAADPDKHEVFSRPKAPEYVLLCINLGQDSLSQLSSQGVGQHRSCYPVANAELVVVNSWGEVSATAISGSDTLLNSLRAYHQIRIAADHVGVSPTIQMLCFNDPDDQLVNRLQQLTTSLDNCFQQNANSRYILKLADGFHIVRQRNNELDVATLSSYPELIQCLERGQEQFSPLHLDPFCVPDSALAAIVAHSHSDDCHLFLHPREALVDIFVRDERGSLCYLANESRDPEALLQQLLGFLQHCRQEQNRQHRVQLHSLRRQDGRWQAVDCPPPPSRARSGLYLEAIAHPRSGAKPVFDLRWNNQLLCHADEGDSVFRRLASQLRERFPDQRRFYLDRLSLADSEPQQTSVYLRYKRYVEELLLQAINET